VPKKYTVKEYTKDTHIVPVKNKPAKSKKIGVEFITTKNTCAESKRIDVNVSKK
jgi:hypothetical protein